MNSKYIHFFSFLSDTVLISSADGNNIEFIGEALVKSLGYSMEDVKNIKLIELVHPKDKNRFQDSVEIAKVVFEKPILPFSCRLLAKNNKWLYFSVSIKNAILISGIEGLVFQLKEITGEVISDRLLKQSEENFRVLAENTQDVIFLANTDGTILYSSPSALKTFEYHAEELLGMNISRFISQSNLKKLHDKILHKVLGSEDFFLVNRCESKNGNSIWIESNIQPIYDNKGKLYKLHISCRDITKRKNIEIRLANSEAIFRSIIEFGSDIIAMTAPEGILLYLSPSGYRILGYDQGTMVGEFLFSYMKEDEKNTFEKLLSNLSSPKNTFESGEFQFKTADNQWKTLEVKASVFHGSSQANLAESVIINARDVTERKENEKKLKESQTRLKLINTIHEKANPEMSALEIIRSTLHEIHLAFPDFRIFYTTPNDSELVLLHSVEPEGSTKKFQFNQSSYCKECFKDFSPKTPFIHFLNDNCINTCPVIINSSSEVYNFIGIATQWNNSLQGVFWVQAVKEPHKWTEHEVTTFKEIGKYFSLTLQEAKIYQEKLKAEEHYRTVFNSASMGIFIADRNNSTMIDVNQAACEIAEKSKEELIGSSYFQYFSSIQEKEELALQLEEKGFLKNISMKINTGENKTKWITASVSKLESSDKSQNHAVVNFYDITSQKIANEELLKYRLQLEDMVIERTEKLELSFKREKELTERLKKYLNQEKEMRLEMEKTLEKERELINLKSRFISMASHEFRTPLTVILSASDNLKRYDEKMSKEEKVKRLDKIKAKVNHMTEMLDDILTVGKIESGTYSVNPEPLNLSQMIHSLTQEYQNSIGKSHQFDINLPIEKILLKGDRKLLNNIFSNLLSNAIKYSSPGSCIHIHLQETEQQAVCSIRDEGIGIPEENQKQLFEAFYRAENVENITGTGLGLFIMKKAVDLHNGKIEFESKPGVGSTFTVTLPLKV